MRRILILVSLLVVCAGAGAAADTRKGYKAYTSGNFKAAIEEFRKSALQGDALAMFYLGEGYFPPRTPQGHPSSGY
jgi:TPR repeat protein